MSAVPWELVAAIVTGALTYEAGRWSERRRQRRRSDS